MVRGGRRAVAIGVALAVLLGASTARAGSFQVNPIRVDLSAKTPTAAVTVTNTGAESVVAQIAIDAWSQQDGKDVYLPTKEVLVTPPVVTIPAGAERIVRVGLRRGADKEHELSYRLFIQEVPPPPQPGFQGLIVALRIGLPVFVRPQSASASPRLAWRAVRLPDNKVQVTAVNSGNAHVQISELSLFAGSPDAVASQNGLAYVLPEQQHSWILTLPAVSATRLQLKAVTDAGNLEAETELSN